ncbi:MAG TPA: hypothetical protein VD866_28100 [Urbifossiella sp.]|nr:hypothetical protein [Urbifossiella sp.]
MSPAVEATPESTADHLSQAILTKLSASPHPLKLADLAKGLPNPNKAKPTAFKTEVIRVVEGEYQVGRVFRYPSGSKQTERFWVRDEKRVLQEAAVAVAAVPVTLAALRTALGRAVKGTDAGFTEGVVRELIGQDRLYEHPPKTKAGGPLFATTPPPPPVPILEQPKFRKRTETLTRSAAKLLADAGVGLDDLVAVFRHRINSASADTGPAPPAEIIAPTQQGTEQLVLATIATAGPAAVLSLADLRRGLPEDHQGPAFDAAVLRLAGDGLIRVYQDADPLRFTPGERAEYVTDADGHVFTAVAPPG